MTALIQANNSAVDKSGQVNKKLEPGVLKQMNIVSELTPATLRSSPKSRGFIPTLKFSIIFSILLMLSLKLLETCLHGSQPSYWMDRTQVDQVKKGS